MNRNLFHVSNGLNEISKLFEFFFIIIFLCIRTRKVLNDTASTPATTESKKRPNEDAKNLEIAILRESELLDLDRNEFPFESDI